MNNLAMLGSFLAMKKFKDNNIDDSSEKSKAFILPMLIKDPGAAVLASNLAAEKAIESKKANTLSSEKNRLQNRFEAVSELAGALSAEIKNLQTIEIENLNINRATKDILLKIQTPVISQSLKDKLRSAFPSPQGTIVPARNIEDLGEFINNLP